MGRLPKNRIRVPLDPNILKDKHRRADTKYRSNVQYLYSKLKEMTQNEAGKDSILRVTLLRIQSLENEIVQKVGSDEMKIYQNDFVNFLLHEEALWKIKDTVKWWKKVDEALNPLNDFIYNAEAGFTDSIRTKKTSKTSGRFSARPPKCKKKFLAHASDFSEDNNTTSWFSKFDKNLLIPHEEGPDSLLSFEEHNYFSSDLSAEPVEFENNLF